MKAAQDPTILLSFNDVSVQIGAACILDNISLSIHTNEQWAIVGPSGSGKTTLAHVFVGKVFYRGELNWYLPPVKTQHIQLLEQQHHFKNLSNTSSFYYQQRFNASESEDSITVAEVLDIEQD